MSPARWILHQERLERGGPCCSLGLFCRSKRFLFCLGSPRRPRTKKILHRTVFLYFFVPIAQQAGQAGLKKLKSWLFRPKSRLFGPTKFTFSGRKGDFSDEKVLFQRTHCLLEFPSGSQIHNPLLGDKGDYVLAQGCRTGLAGRYGAQTFHIGLLRIGYETYRY